MKLIATLLALFVCFSIAAQTELPFVDIHLHASIKPFNSLNNFGYNHWEVIEHSCESNFSKFFVKNAQELPRRSQSNFESLVKGNVRIGFLSLTPLEEKMLQPRLLNLNKRGVATFNCISGVQTSLWEIKQKDRDYWEDLHQNLKMVLSDENKPYYIYNQPHYYQFIRNKSDLQKTIDNPNIMGVLLNIEGAHALGHSFHISRNITDKQEYENLIMKNVDRLKGLIPLNETDGEILDVPVLSIGLCHFFWNGLAGHARTFSGTQEFIFGRQKKSNRGFTNLGKKLVTRMLDKTEGRRILVDIKHLSLQSRKEYYALLDSMMAKGDTIPIISSHSTVSSLAWTDKAYSKKNDNYKKNKKTTLNEWTISLAKEDLLKIVETKGLAGIMLDKYRLMGGKTKKLHKKTIEGSKQRNQLLIDVIMANVFMVIKQVDSPKAWDIVCIGSDYDGMIIPPDNYKTAEDWLQMADDFRNFLTYPHALFDVFTKQEIEALMYNYTPDEIVRKIMSENGINFLMRNLPE